MAHDGRTVHLTVLDNDPDTSGERPPIAGAEIVVIDAEGRKVARATTESGGAAGLAIPAELLPQELVAEVTIEGFNTRHIRLNGTNVVLDLRAALYGGG